MPQIFDNLTPATRLADALQATLAHARRADFCIGYFNLRGWQRVADYMDTWAGTDDNRCRLLVGMQQQPENMLREYYGPGEDEPLDLRRAKEMRQKLARNFREQLTIGIPTAQDEKYLLQLREQLATKKVVVKLFLRHPLHAKLYLLFRDDFNNPVTGYLGSSNLTFSGLSGNGELNIDVLDKDAATKLAGWFEQRWNERFCVDITEELIAVLDESWVREKTPYHIYLKIAYHLAADARAGATGYQVPTPFDKQLFAFQQSAVQMAARHLDKRGGVLIGDVVGLGKTITAAAIVKLFEQRDMTKTLIICPVNLVPMWRHYVKEYNLKADVLPISRVQTELAFDPANWHADPPHYGLVVVDESHNLRNREGRRYRVLHEYLHRVGSKVVLLSATPYNKAYTDLSSQLGLFLKTDDDLGVAPERYINSLEGGIREFRDRHQAEPRTLAAFDKSTEYDDWRELMRLFMVRRTRDFLKASYTELDKTNNRHYLTYANGSRAYFPERMPLRVEYGFTPGDPADQYARLYSEDVVDQLNALELPRYGLGLYLSEAAEFVPRTKEEKELDRVVYNLGRAGTRLKGFCRTNLFKRLESSGYAFLLSLSRHVLRNYIFLYALENGLPLPIGQQGAELLDSRADDQDPDLYAEHGDPDDPTTDDDNHDKAAGPGKSARWDYTSDEYEAQAATIYGRFAGQYRNRFDWVPADFFVDDLPLLLRQDVSRLQHVLALAHDWQPAHDRKLNALFKLCAEKHPNEKILIFTQFADTTCYLTDELQRRKLTHLTGVTGTDADPSAVARRFSPHSNGQKGLPKGQEIRILISTDVLSEGQNLQDAHIIVNYDLPWAIIRLIQRAGRVDRIGQQATDVFCYSFLPEDGIENIINLRGRLVQRLRENAEVVGTDEIFLDEEIGADATGATVLRDLYNERNGVLNDTGEAEVDLASQAYAIWQNAIAADPALATIVPGLAAVSHATQATHLPDGGQPGVVLYARTAHDHDVLVWVDREGKLISQAPGQILRAAACTAATPGLPRSTTPDHFELVREALKLADTTISTIGGQLGPKSGARYRVYHALNRYREGIKNTLFDTDVLLRAIQEVHDAPLRPGARDQFNRLLKANAPDEQLAECTVALYEQGQLGVVHETSDATNEPQILCSMGLV